jgi:hypothetical protein
MKCTEERTYKGEELLRLINCKTLTSLPQASTEAESLGVTLVVFL